MRPKNRKDRVWGLIAVNTEKIDEQLNLWAVRINGLAARNDFQKEIDGLKIKRTVSQAMVDEFKAAGTEKWKEFKSGIGSAWDDLGAADWKMLPNPVDLSTGTAGSKAAVKPLHKKSAQFEKEKHHVATNGQTRSHNGGC